MDGGRWTGVIQAESPRVGGASREGTELWSSEGASFQQEAYSVYSTTQGSARGQP